MPERASDRAHQLDKALEHQATSIVLPVFKEVLAQIRVYLLKQNLRIGNRNNVYQILKEASSGNIRSITLGPQIDRGPTNSHYYMGSGGRLSFGLAFREQNRTCSLVAYRFHFYIAPDAVP